MTENQLLRDALNTAQSKLLSAQICHPNAVQFLIEEAIDAINAALAKPAEGGEVADYKALYEDAMRASNEAGFVGFDAAATIRALSELTTPPASQEGV